MADRRTSRALGNLFKVGDLSVGRSFGPLVAFFALATIFIVWLGMRIQRVGYPAAN